MKMKVLGDVAEVDEEDHGDDGDDDDGGGLVERKCDVSDKLIRFLIFVV